MARMARRIARLVVLGCGLSAFGSAAARDQPMRVGYADPSGLVKPEPLSGDAPMLPAPEMVPTTPPKPPLPIDLPYALRLANAGNPTIAIAQLRVEESYARLQQARAQWLPNLWAGSNPDNMTFLPTYYVHNGIIQNSRGQIFDAVKAEASFPVGTGLNLSIADALFGPRIARDLVAAEQARSRVVTYNVQLDVALTYLDLVRVYGALAVNREALSKAEYMLVTAEKADGAGLTLTTADVNRARTEVEMRRQERIDLEAEAAVVSAHLAQLLLLEPTVDLIPAEARVLPIELVPSQMSLNELVDLGINNRPEVAVSRAELAAAQTRWTQERVRPLIPNVQMAYYGSQFGGGIPAINDYGWRNDFMIQVNWELRNGGAWNLFESRAWRTETNIANLHVTEVQAAVAADVTAAAKIVLFRERELANAQKAVRQAEEMWEKLKRAGFGLATGFGGVGAARRYDPVQPILAEQALHDARMRYLNAVIDYNRNQFRLFWALGQPPVCALPRATALPVYTPVLPSAEQQAKPTPGK